MASPTSLKGLELTQLQRKSMSWGNILYPERLSYDREGNPAVGKALMRSSDPAAIAREPVDLEEGRVLLLRINDLTLRLSLKYGKHPARRVCANVQPLHSDLTFALLSFLATPRCYLLYHTRVHPLHRLLGNCSTVCGMAGVRLGYSNEG